MESPSLDNRTLFSSPIVYVRFLMLGVLFIGVGLLINKVPSLSPPKLEVVESKESNQSMVLSDNKEDNSSASNDGKSVTVKINTASQSELESLNGVGPKIAQKIIAGRPYASPMDLVAKHVISLKLFEQIKNQISL